MPKDDLRTRKFLVSLTESEREEILKAAAGVPPAIWVRLAALEKAARLRAIAPMSPELKAMPEERQADLAQLAADAKKGRKR